jgi:hypothetical protein
MIDIEGWTRTTNDGVKRYWWDQSIKEYAFQCLWGHTSGWHITPFAKVHAHHYDPFKKIWDEDLLNNFPNDSAFSVPAKGDWSYQNELKNRQN